MSTEQPTREPLLRAQLDDHTLLGIAEIAELFEVARGTPAQWRQPHLL
jgi:hypothetical protein